MGAYLDNSATTRPSGPVRQLAARLMESGWMNPSALYRPAMEVQKQMDAVRGEVLRAVEASPGDRVVFTSGGTEADNLAILGALRARKAPGRVLFTAIEHPAVSACAEEIRRMGFTAEQIAVTQEAAVDLEKLSNQLGPDVMMIIAMQVNNETGTVQPLDRIAALRDRLCPGAALHVDGVQGFLRLPVGFHRLGLQSYALSGHKIQALKGIGALVLQKGHLCKPLMLGGGQENGERSGTENTLGILALGEAVRTWDPAANDRMRTLKTRLWQGIRQAVPSAELNGPACGAENAAPHILNVSLRPVRSQTLLFALEGDGIYVSAGSACASKKQKISPVLKAMGLSTDRADCALRFSLSPETTEIEIDQTVERVAAHYALLSRYTRR